LRALARQRLPELQVRKKGRREPRIIKERSGSPKGLITGS
jgi:hypothetical protein